MKETSEFQSAHSSVARFLLVSSHKFQSGIGLWGVKDQEYFSPKELQLLKTCLLQEAALLFSNIHYSLVYEFELLYHNWHYLAILNIKKLLFQNLFDS